MESNINENNQIKRTNIMQSQIFGNEQSPTAVNKGINNSVSPYMAMPGMSLKGSIMPLGNFEEIREENEEYTNNEDAKEANDKDTKDEMMGLGGKYIGEGYDENEAVKEQFKEKKKKITQSRLKTSFNIFSFTNKDDDNYVNDLKNEINDLYKKRDKMEDQITEQKEKINNSKINNNKFLF